MKKTLKTTLLITMAIVMSVALFACAPAAPEASATPEATVEATPEATATPEASEPVEENGASSVVGKWDTSEVIDPDGTKATEEELEIAAVSYEFKADGTVIANLLGQEVEATWTQTGATVEIDSEGTPVEGTIDGDTLTFVSAAGTMIFTRA